MSGGGCAAASTQVDRELTQEGISAAQLSPSDASDDEALIKASILWDIEVAHTKAETRVGNLLADLREKRVAEGDALYYFARILKQRRENGRLEKQSMSPIFTDLGLCSNKLCVKDLLRGSRVMADKTRPCLKSTPLV